MKPPPSGAGRLEEAQTLPSAVSVTSCRLRAPAPLEAVARLVDRLRIHPLLAATLWARGLRDDAAERLAPDLDLAAIPALPLAAERLAEAIAGGERILLHGDYDADGITATALLTRGLRALGASATPFVPDRLQDGYGIHPARVESHAAAADLLVTVDCGITDLAQVAALRAAGVDVIVSDHHLAGARRPDALVVHPHDGCGTADLTGAGVAYHLLWALHERLGLGPPLELVDLAAVGTIADVAPLLGPNRALVRVGLERLADSQHPGLRALVALAKLRRPLTARQVAFVLAPRLNAPGRMGNADLALELLLTADERRGRILATLLESLNEERRGLQDRMLEQALALADEAPALVLRHPDWHPGVTGIIANQVLERCNKPAFVVAGGKGSARSNGGISALAALDAAGVHLRRWGGHATAAGFTLDERNFDAFREAICAYVASIEAPQPGLLADVVLHPGQIDADLYKALEALEPYGHGHPEPLFALTARFDQVRAMGQRDRHLQASLEGVRAVGWGMGHLNDRWRAGDDALGLATLAASTWKERTTIELRLVELAPAGKLQLADEAAAGTDSVSVPLGRLRVGPPPADAAARGLHLHSLEANDDEPLAPLAEALRAGDVVYLDLGSDAPGRLRRLAREYPSVGDARQAFVYRMRGLPWPWDGPLSQRLESVLRELDVIDERGRARVGRRVEPLDAATMRRALLARHALESAAALLEALPPEEAAAALRYLVAPVEQAERHLVSTVEQAEP